MARNRPLHGVFWMVLTGLCFVGVAAVVKHMGGRVPAAQAAFLRYILGLVFLIPMIKPMLDEGLDAWGWKMFGLRGIVHSLGVTTWFFAMGILPVAEVTAMNYLVPVLVTIGAAVFLGERLAMRRIMAVVVAMIGVLIILRPGFREVGLAHLAMLFTASMFAAGYLIAKVMADRVSPTMVVGMLSITVTIGLAPMAIAVWETPLMTDVGWLFVVAALATAGHYTMTFAFREAPVTVTQPVTFLQLLWATLVGLLLFNEPLDGYVILGGVLIMASVIYITWREAQKAKVRKP